MNPLASIKCARRIMLGLAAMSVLFLTAGCGSSSSPSTNQEGFSAGSLTGTYVFSFSGVDTSSGNTSFFAAVGTLTADGKGNFTAGTVDLNDPALEAAIGATSNVFTGESATGTYSVGTDGRGTGSLSVVITGTTAKVPIGLDFVLTATGGLSAASTHGLITRSDSNGTGSGTIDLQASGITQSGLQGSYAFGFSGSDVNNQPFGTVGAFTLDSSGNISTGLQDFNDDGSSPEGINSTGYTLTGNVTVGASSTTASLTTSEGTFDFDVFVIDNTHLKFIETDTQAILAGDAFTQETSIPAGVYAYTTEGLDSAGDPIGMGGFFTSDGNGGLSSVFEEYNDTGTLDASPLTGSGSYTAVTGGRTQITLNTFFNGETLTGAIIFAAYPSSGGIQMLEIDGGGVTGGLALAQGSTTTLATSAGYGLNLTAENGNGEEDDIAQFVLNSNTYTGSEDIHDEGSSPLRGQAFNGTLTPDATVPGHGSAASTTGEINFNYYLANSGSTALILETDNNQVGVGSFISQGTGAIPVAAHARFAAMHSRPTGRAAGKQMPK